MSDQPPQPPRPSRIPRIIISLAVAAAIVIASVACAIYFLAVKGPLALVHGAKEETFDSAQRMANGFKNVFNFTPQITVNGVTEVVQANSVMELATVSQGVVEHYEWSQSWFGSTKDMELQGIYQAKAGFDLRAPFRISVTDGRITATLPDPKLLSIEMTNYKVLRDESGWWNKITSDDREKAIAAMQDEARSKAEQSGILTEAKTRFKAQFCEVIKGEDISMPVDVTFRNELPAVSIPPQR
jgi:hypothetical protein